MRVVDRRRYTGGLLERLRHGGVISLRGVHGEGHLAVGCVGAGGRRRRSARAGEDSQGGGRDRQPGPVRCPRGGAGNGVTLLLTDAGHETSFRRGSPSSNLRLRGIYILMSMPGNGNVNTWGMALNFLERHL